MGGTYEISEMARLFGISRQTLIYYDRIGLFTPAEVSDAGYRFYAPTQIPVLRLICILRDLGISLKEISRLISSSDTSAIERHLTERLDDIDQQIAGLQSQRSGVAERLAFYRDVEFWRERLGEAQLMHFPARHVVFEPFPEGVVARPMLHATLMRAIDHLRSAGHVAPVRGWGTMLLRDAFAGGDPLAGAGPFVVMPAGIHPEDCADVRELPEGTYLCFSRWGMPYNLAGVHQLEAFLNEHRLRAVSDVYDFCLLDATNYDDIHDEDLCCLQVLVELDG